MSEHKRKQQEIKQETEESTVYEGEVVDPEELEDEEFEDVDDAEDSGKKKSKKSKEDGFLKRSGRAVRNKLDSITIWDVLKGVGLFALGAGAGAATMYVVGKKGDATGDRRARIEKKDDFDDLFDDNADD